MNKQYIDLLTTTRSDGYKIGYMDGREQANIDHKREYNMIINELHIVQKREAWLQNKLIRTKENYEGQVNNLLNKVNYYEELLHRKKTEYIDRYTDMKGE